MLIDGTNRLGGEIDLDPCSNEHSIVRATVEYMLPDNNGLEESWDYPRIYVNPPYGADRTRGTTIKHWLYRCARAYSKHGSQVLALVPVAPNTSHWKEFVWGEAAGVCFLYDTRLRFLVQGLDGGKGAPMACAMVYWGEDYERFSRIFLEFGAVVDIRSLVGKDVGPYDVRGRVRNIGRSKRPERLQGGNLSLSL